MHHTACSAVITHRGEAIRANLGVQDDDVGTAGEKVQLHSRSGCCVSRCVVVCGLAATMRCVCQRQVSEPWQNSK